MDNGKTTAEQRKIDQETFGNASHAPGRGAPYYSSRGRGRGNNSRGGSNNGRGSSRGSNPHTSRGGSSGGRGSNEGAPRGRGRGRGRGGYSSDKPPQQKVFRPVSHQPEKQA